VPYEGSEAVVRHLHTLFNVGVIAGSTDGQLLEQFTCQRREAAEVAFAALLQRHGPMVLRACLEIVGNDHDAQDAFQATFLILARKGRTLWVRDTLGPWLHRVAKRAAIRVKTTANRQRAIERRVAEIGENRGRFEKRSREDLGQALHEEVDQLPSHYRLAIVLCDLEGHSYDEAARYLGCPVGTVRSRLARGRERLRGRLVRRGLAPAAELANVAIVSNATPMNVPVALLESTIQAVVRGHKAGSATAGVVVSASVFKLADGVLRAMLWTKVKTMIALTLAAGVTVVSLGLLARGAHDGPRRGRLEEPGRTESQAAAAPSAAPLKPTQVRGKEAPSRPRSVFEAREPIRAFSNQTKAWAYNPETKTWHTYTAPKGVQVYELSQNPREDFVVVGLSGEVITEVAAFSINSGRWIRHTLTEPARVGLAPIISTHLAAYFVGRHVYAFSSLTGKWSTQILSEPVQRGIGPEVWHGDGFMVHAAGRHAYAVIAETGNWTVLEMEKGATAAAHPGPSGTTLVSGGDRLYTVDPKTGQFHEIKAIED
jgi:RNA polymerase sigma factor (sigma-70 family)